jgi:hypothetical protein
VVSGQWQKRAWCRSLEIVLIVAFVPDLWRAEGGKRLTVGHSAPSAKSVGWGRNAKTEDERDRGRKLHPIFFYDS